MTLIDPCKDEQLIASAAELVVILNRLRGQSKEAMINRSQKTRSLLQKFTLPREVVLVTCCDAHQYASIRRFCSCALSGDRQCDAKEIGWMRAFNSSISSWMDSSPPHQINIHSSLSQLLHQRYIILLHPCFPQSSRAHSKFQRGKK
jgi:hypothetical protein